MNLQSSNAADLANMLKFTSDDIEVVRLIRDSISYFWIEYDQGFFSRATEFKYTAALALQKLTDPNVLAAWLPKVQELTTGLE